MFGNQFNFLNLEVGRVILNENSLSFEDEEVSCKVFLTLSLARAAVGLDPCVYLLNLRSES